MLLTACLICWGCSGAPAWPAEGVADARWVAEALEWRLKTGLDDCGENARAVDALTLEWIAGTSEVQLIIETDEWPVLRYYPELKTTLIQAMARQQLEGEETDVESLQRTLRKVVRKTAALKNRRVKPYLKGRRPQTS